MAKKEIRKIDGRLKAYGAVAASALLAVPAADAAINYSGVQNIGIGSSSGQDSALVDLDGGGQNDFSFSYASDSYFYLNTITTTPQNDHVGDGNGYPAVLGTGYQIGPTLGGPNQWAKGSGVLAGDPNGPSGNFSGTQGCLGVRFFIGSERHYGWIRLDNTFSGDDDLRIVDWAYETTPDAPIGACVTASAEPTAAVSAPTLNEWGLIFLISLLAGLSLKTLRGQERG